MPIARGNQERYLLAERFTDASYPIPFSYRVSGPLNAERLQKAISIVVHRHEVMRSFFKSKRGGFSASIKGKATIKLDCVSLQHQDDVAIRDTVASFFNQKIDKLEPDRLVKAQLICLGKESFIFTFSLHHAIGDAISVDYVVDEIFSLYLGEDIPEPKIDYYEIVEGIDAQPSADDAVFWREALAGVEEVASLTADLDSPDRQGGELEKDLPFETVSQLARQCGVTPFEATLAVTAAILARFSGSDDVQMTFQSSGRKLLAQSQGVVGPFSNSIVLRQRVEKAQTIEKLASQVRENVRAGLAHERQPYHLVVRETGVQPSFGCNWFPQGQPRQYGDLVLSDREFLFYDSNYDLNIRFVRSDDRLRLLLHFDPSKFSDARIDSIGEALVNALGLASRSPQSTVGEVWPSAVPLQPVASPEQNDERIYDAWLKVAHSTPDRLALKGSGMEFTYGDLNRKSADLGKKLLDAGLGKGDRIAILAERGPQLVINMLAVLRIGAIMVPFDGEYPAERLQTMEKIAQPHGIILPNDTERPEWLSKKSISITSDAGPTDQLTTEDPRLQAGDAAHPAYMLFTSGTTGVPKCIATSHAPVVHFLRWQPDTFAFHSEDRFTNLCGIAHDMMIRDVFAPLSIGAQLAIPRQETIFNPGALMDWCQEQGATVSHLTPAMGKLLGMARDATARLPFRIMFFGGDRLEPSLIEQMRSLAPAAKIVNFYGTTETPQAAAYSLCETHERWRSQPIGTGIDAVDLRLIDEQGEPVPAGVEGEIVVRSPYLSLGYVENAEIVPRADPDEYRTGDIGMVVSSGEIMFLGRRDDQISIRGYRIELNEIGTAITEHPAAEQATVLVDKGSREKLVAFVVGDVDPDVIYAWLMERLPHYMVPGDIVVLKKLPLLPNGKLDRQTLLAMPRPRRAKRNLRGPETEQELELVQAWEQQLGIEGISPEQSFAELHADSLAYVQVFLATEEIVGELPDEWQTLPIEQIAKKKRTKVSIFKWIDSALAIRAAAIVTIVALHLHFFSIGGGATSALFLVSGYLIGKLQLNEVVRQFSVKPFLMLFWRVFLPSIIYAIVFYISKILVGKPVSLSIPLMYADFIDYRDRAEVIAEGHTVFFWYIAAFLHIMLAICLLSFGIMKILGREKLTAFRLALGLFLIGLPMKFLLPGLLNAEIFANGIPPMSVYGFLPTSHFSTLLLGACVALAVTSKEKAQWTAVVILYSVGTFLLVPGNSYMIMLLAGAVLLYLPRVLIPRWLHLPVLYLSGASLFIYLTHAQVAGFITGAGMPDDSLMLVPITIAIGIVFWMIWQKLSPIARKISPI